jgi:uncharacterized protein YbjT (DUF2867 family)
VNRDDVSDLPRIVALTGATGYVGGRLLRAFEERGIPVRCLARRPEALEGRVAPTTEVRSADLRRPREVTAALEGVDTAYYLIHSMGSNSRFDQEDRHTAVEFGRAARACGVRRIIYLGGLGAGAALSSHLASRQEVGKILRESGVPTIEFRASIVIGSGSLSFELIRSLVDRLPVMLTPSWVRTLTQPIAIDDVVAYLIAALDVRGDASPVYEIGGPQRVSYGDLMREYARQRNLRRIVVPVPVLTPRISSLWLGLITPVYARVGRKLIDGVRNETIVHDTSALRAFAVEPRPVAEAIALAIADGAAGGPMPRRPGARFCVARRSPCGVRSSIHAGSRFRFRPRSPSVPSSASADARAGTTATGFGTCAALSICCLAGSVCGVVDATRLSSRPAIRSTSGGSRPSSRTACFAWWPR